ncbi:TonB-dependent receptor [Sunxiuqinia elliptica]|uniref:TonB-linked outer membrane protein, SusC/RagA family n=1 Tax=Sunxiuqinia elliptica TaxID=655355 RepID=A0A1I2KVH5_9BACT|nr:TonB-dependent receptor [Sunxiuqinia elliptica]SFF70339.1 TonB-linked outer membrane protein, SusC/RagA family [Sunxiuqinia elliptica]
MKKLLTFYCRPGRWRKILLTMKLVLFFLFGSLMVVHASSFSQNSKLNLDLKKVSIRSALNEIEEQTDYYFFYNEEEFDVEREVSVSIKDASVSLVLERILQNSGMKYEVVDNYVVIRKQDVGTTQERLYDKKQQGEVPLQIRGKVTDGDGQPIPGANVTIQGTLKGTITDNEGYYVIQAKKGDILVFSFIGFEAQTVEVSDKLAIDVTLKEAVTLLEEAVVVGMGSQRKASVIGSISSIKTQELAVPQRSLVSTLSGRIAGATIVQRSGEPGYDNASFWVRGIATLGSNKSPLVLVDGVERDMTNIAVEEIESISILKDASATAVYGVRAANGVVLVTTRKGVAQKPVVEFKLESGISDLPNMPKFVGGADYARLYNEAFGQENYSEEYINYLERDVNRFLYPNVNWFDQIFKKWSNNTNANLTIRGGGERARYFISGGFIQDNGNFKDYGLNDYNTNINLKRYNFRSNIDITVTKSTIVNLEIGANLIDIHEPGVGNRSHYGRWFGSPSDELFYWAYQSTPLSSPVRLPIGREPDGSIEWGWGAPSQVGELNPAERLHGSGYNTRFNTQITSQVVLNQDLSMLVDGLNFKGFFSFDSNNNTIQRRNKLSSTYSVDGVDDDTGDLIVKEVNTGQEFLRYSSSSGANRAIEAKAQLNYDKSFNTNHRVGGMFMYYQRDYIDGTAGSSIMALPYRKQGIAFRGTYSYRDIYFGEFNLGYNGSENFPKDNRFGLFPAGAIGYLISNESFWNSEVVNLFKIRASVGLVGSDALPNNYRYGYLSTWGNGLGSYGFGFNPTIIGGIGEDQIGVSSLTWEKGLKKNVGFELGLFENAFSMDVDFFHERRSDILIQRGSMPAVAGLNQTPYANMGVMENQGFETTLELNNSIDKFSYRLYGNFTFTRNKVIEMDEPLMEYEYRMRTGHPLGQRFGLIAEGLFRDQAEIDNSPEQKFGVVRPGDVKYKDINNDGVIDINDETAIGYTNVPEIIYGFGAQLMWRGIDFGVFFRGQARVTYALGGNTFIPFSEGVGKGNVFEKALDRWTEENPDPNAFYPRHSNGRSSNNWQASTRNIYDGSLLRLADMELGYTFDKKLVSRIGLESVRIHVLATNLAVFSHWDMWDPETATPNGNRYPIPRKINFGIRTTF